VTVSYVERNRAAWAEWSKNFARHAEQLWPQEEITWGQCRVPEAKLNLLGDVTEKDVVELGCGTAYFSSWLARRGARPIGVDLTPSHFETARRMQARHGIEFPLIEANAHQFGLHRVDRVRDSSTEFHLAHGEWIRLLRANGFTVESLVELAPEPGGGESDQRVPVEWARRWPMEGIWKATKVRG
jgi:SAM-dependent methyltransferase